ncbi:MAG: ACT domain-containing protein, partial [Clostridiales bacterium]|nr:ACT domain-containing protein [Clostridiales bacterium]
NTSVKRVLTLNLMLVDEPGILSSLISELYRIGANIVTINQNIPVDGVAPVSVSLRIDRDRSDIEVVELIAQVSGVVSVRTVNA